MEQSRVMVEGGKFLRTLGSFQAPFGQSVELQEILFDEDVKLLRLHIREGNRFTVFDLDPKTAQAWGETLCNWASAKLSEGAD